MTKWFMYNHDFFHMIIMIITVINSVYMIYTQLYNHDN